MRCVGSVGSFSKWEALAQQHFVPLYLFSQLQRTLANRPDKCAIPELKLYCISPSRGHLSGIMSRRMIQIPVTLGSRHISETEKSEANWLLQSVLARSPPDVMAKGENRKLVEYARDLIRVGPLYLMVFLVSPRTPSISSFRNHCSSSQAHAMAHSCLNLVLAASLWYLDRENLTWPIISIRPSFGSPLCPGNSLIRSRHCSLHRQATC